MKKNKEHKKGESTIGKIIYGFLLFMPLFAIGVTCLVNTFNNQAKEEVEIQYKYETNEVNSASDLKVGNIYKVTFTSNTATSSTLVLQASAVYNVKNYDYYYSDTTTENRIINIRFVTSGGIAFQNVSNNGIYNISGSTISYPFTFYAVFYELPTNDFVNYTNFSISDYNVITGTSEKDLNNIFYYSVDKVTESPLFSWATNSVIYTTMNATCTQLSITTPFIPLLLSYWLIISVIYFLYDIALMLIWLLHDKIHEMRDNLA